LIQGIAKLTSAYAPTLLDDHASALVWHTAPTAGLTRRTSSAVGREPTASIRHLSAVGAGLLARERHAGGLAHAISARLVRRTLAAARREPATPVRYLAALRVQGRASRRRARGGAAHARRTPTAAALPRRARAAVEKIAAPVPDASARYRLQCARRRRARR